MIKKRIVALMAAATMLLNVTPVLAADATGQATASGSGTVNAYDDTPIYVVTLPTGNVLDFTVDPYGLLDLASGASVSMDQLANTGAIVAASGAAAIIKNMSSVPVTVTLNMTAQQSGSTITFMKKGSEVVTGDATNMFLAIIPSAEKADSAATYKAASYAIPITDTASEAKFKLDKAAYQVVNNNGSFSMEIVSGASNFDATAFKVGGVVNPAGDWSKFVGGSAETVSLGVVFSYAAAADAEVVDTASGVYGLVSGSAADITNDISGGTGALSGKGMKKSSESGIDYEIAEYSISKPYEIHVENGKTPKSTTIGVDPTDATARGGASVSADNKVITMPANAFGSGAIGQVRYISVNFTDDTSLVIKLVKCVN